MGLLGVLVSRGAAAEDLEEEEVEAIDVDKDDDEGITWTGAEEQFGVQSRRVNSWFLTGTCFNNYISHLAAWSID